MTTIVDDLTAALSNRYRIERELGVGGMATVYLAEDVRHHRKVAIKVLHPELSSSLGPERFLNEIALTVSLQHPHILPLFDSGSVDGQLFYVMPFVRASVGLAMTMGLMGNRDAALRIIREVEARERRQWVDPTSSPLRTRALATPITRCNGSRRRSKRRRRSCCAPL